MKNKFNYLVIFSLIFSVLLTACSKNDDSITIPSNITNLTADAGAEQITLSWDSPSDTDLIEYWITIDPLVMDSFRIDKTLETYTIENLEGGIEYTITVRAKNKSGGVSSGLSVSATPSVIDRTPPSEVTSYTAEPANGQISLNWKKPNEPDLAGYELTYEPGNSSKILDKNAESFVITGLTNDIEYTITLKTKDDVGNISSGVMVKATPKEGDNTPPAELSDFSFSGDYSAMQFTINWKNPSDTDFEEVELSYFYGSETPVVETIPNTENTYTIDGSYEQNYVLTFKTKDKNGNYSVGVTKKIRFGNFGPGSQEDVAAFDRENIAILAGKLKINGTDVNDLSNFSNLEIVEGKFDIKGNEGLNNLDAFSNLKLISSRILITDNVNLSDFCGLKNLINSGGAPDSYTVTGNASNPTKQEILDNCN